MLANILIAIFIALCLIVDTVVPDLTKTSIS